MRSRRGEEKYHYQMASSKGKARARPEKKRTAERKPRANVRSRGKPTRYKRADTPHRRLYDSVSIPQLVYELLTIDKYNQDAKRFQSSGRLRTPHRTVRKYHDQQRLRYESTGHRDIPESVQVSDYVMESEPTSVESLTEPMDANSSAPTSSANSSVSNISMQPTTMANSLNNVRALFRKKSLVQLINSYIKAGIDEGKRQAKMYIRKALSFGVKSGYLIPADPQGNVLRVCPTLDTGSWRSKRADAESRERRRIARRGGANLTTTMDDRKAMRRGISRDKPRPEDKDNGQTSSTRETTPRKTFEKNKPKTVVSRKRKFEVNNNKRRQQRKRSEGVKKPVRRRRREILSPKLSVKNWREPVEESYNDVNNEDRDRNKSDEDNYRPAAESWKSMALSRTEGESRMERQKAGTNIDDDRDETDRAGADKKSGEEEASCVERNASDMIREINDA